MGKNSDSWSKESYREHNNNNNNRDNEKQRGYRSYSNSRRSSDYRNEDFYSNNNHKNDEHEYGDRKYRQHNDPHHHHSRHKDHFHHHRDRDRRSRSRSNERDVSYNRYHDSDDSRNSERYEEKDRYHRERKEEKPNNTLMIRNLPLHVTDKDITLEISRYGLFPKDVRLMRNKETGQSRGFAFIEFATIEQATQLKELAQNYITIGGEHECSLHFSFPKDAILVDKNVLKSDWCCPKCGINNFKRRDECFKCGTSKEELRPYEENNELVQQPSNVLLLQNLSPLTTEETVLIKIGTLTTLPIKSIRMIIDNSTYPQTNICSLELHSVYEATELFQIISSMADGLMIDNHLVSIMYGQRMESLVSVSTSAASQNAAMAALAAAQWKNLDDSSNIRHSQAPKSNSGTVTLNGVEYTKYNTPDFNSFQYDSTSGFYYDPSTGFYYDSNSQYFYNSQTQKYMYYDTANQIYITVDSNGQATSENLSTATASVTNTTATVTITTSKAADESQKQTVEDKADKVKIAKKIAKDMEKWAKTLNQKKELPKTQLPISHIALSETTETTKSLSSNASFYVFEKQLSNPDGDSNVPKDSSLSDPFEIIKTEEEKLIDRNRLACLLCKRQFNSIELLVKHQQLSGLHKTNLSLLRRTLLNQEQLEHVEKVERDLGYRDRAKERRDKYGIDDIPDYIKHKFDVEKESNEPTPTIAPPISDDNIGNRMLKAMGWTEGTGLGKSNQGMSGIIEVERRKSGLGLGNQNATFTRESYKDAVRRTALQRFKELNNK